MQSDQIESSFPRKRESRATVEPPALTPACAGVTVILFIVMALLVPAIHVDPRDTPGDDDLVRKPL